MITPTFCPSRNSRRRNLSYDVATKTHSWKGDNLWKCRVREWNIARALSLPTTSLWITFNKWMCLYVSRRRRSADDRKILKKNVEGKICERLQRKNKKNDANKNESWDFFFFFTSSLSGLSAVYESGFCSILFDLMCVQFLGWKKKKPQRPTNVIIVFPLWQFLSICLSRKKNEIKS